MKIAILGWGSLLWDSRPEFASFQKQHESWKDDGPTLRLEFSRISSSRKGALTLVLETEPNGTLCQVAYAASKRDNLDDVRCDLRYREGTELVNIGFCVTTPPGQSHGRCSQAISSILKWAAEPEHKFDVVVWTDLDSNFQQKRGRSFSLEEAILHLQGLDREGKSKAAEYVWRAPDFIRTPLRSTLEAIPWFAAAQPNEGVG